jgi:endogenous inhibitor of DNA gyrase (YacG/DUF329 family)
MKEQRDVSGRCPICGKPRDHRFRPFCSRACRDRDFLAWADGRYAIPAVEDTDEETDRPGEDSHDDRG